MTQDADPQAEQHYTEQEHNDHALTAGLVDEPKISGDELTMTPGATLAAAVTEAVSKAKEKALSPNLYQRILAVMNECTYVRKDTTVSGFGPGYRAVSHDAVMAKIRPYLVSHGVVPIFTTNSVAYDRFQATTKNGTREVNRASAHVTLTLINADDPKQTTSIDGYGQGDDNGDKACGKAVSYACKYAILKAFMLETGEDTDNDASVDQIRTDDKARDEAATQARNLIALLEVKNPTRAGTYREKLKLGNDDPRQIVRWLTGELKKYEEPEAAE